MRGKKLWWQFQGETTDPRVAQQELELLLVLQDGLLELERKYLATHGEKVPVHRLLSILNRHMVEHVNTIEQHLIEKGL